jgi:hypothetical protein
MPVIDDEKLKQALATLAGRTAEQFAEGIATGASALRSLSELATGRPTIGGLAPFLEQLPERTARAFGLKPYAEASERERAIANLISFLPEILAAGAGAAAVGMARMKGGSLPLGKPQSWIEFGRDWGRTERTGSIVPPEEYRKWAERLKKEGFIHFKPTGISSEDVFARPEQFMKGIGYYKQEASPLAGDVPYVQPLGARVLLHPFNPADIGPRELATVTEFGRPGSEIITQYHMVSLSEKLRDLLSRKEVKSFYYWLGEDVGKAMEITQRIADQIAKGAPKWAIAEEQKRLAKLLGIDPSKNFGTKVVEKLQDILADRFYDITVIRRRAQLFAPIEGTVDWPSGVQHIRYSALPGLSTEAGTILSNYYESIGRNRLEPLQVIENVYVVREKDLARWAAKRPGPTRAALALMSTTDVWANEPYAALSRIPYSLEGTRPIKTAQAKVIPRKIRELFPETRAPRHYDRLTPPGSAQLAFSEFHPSAALVMRPVNEWPIPEDEAREFFAKWERPDRINLFSQEGKTPFLAVSEVQSDIEQNPEMRRRIIVGHTKLLQDSAEFWGAVEKANQAWERFFATVESLPDSKAVLSLFEGGPFDLARIKKDPLGFLGTLMFYTSDVPEPDFYRRGTEITINDVAEALIESLLASKPRTYPRAGEQLLDIFRRIQVPKTQLLTYFGDPLTPEIAPDLDAAVKMMILSVFNSGMDNHPLEGYIRLIDRISQRAFTAERQAIRPRLEEWVESSFQALKESVPKVIPQSASIMFTWPDLATHQMEFIGARARDMMAMTTSNYEKAWQLREMIQESRGILRKLHETAKKVFNAEYRPWGLDYRDFVIRHAFTTAYHLDFPFVGFASGSVPARRWVGTTVPFGAQLVITGPSDQPWSRFNIKANGMLSTASRSVLKRVMPRIENGERDFSVVLNDFRDFLVQGNVAAAYDVLYDDLLLDRVRALLRYHKSEPLIIHGAIGITNMERAMKEGGYYLIPVQELAPIMQYASANDTVIEEPTAVA